MTSSALLFCSSSFCCCCLISVSLRANGLIIACNEAGLEQALQLSSFQSQGEEVWRPDWNGGLVALPRLTGLYPTATQMAHAFMVPRTRKPPPSDPAVRQNTQINTDRNPKGAPARLDPVWKVLAKDGLRVPGGVRACAGCCAQEDVGLLLNCL